MSVADSTSTEVVGTTSLAGLTSAQIIAKFGSNAKDTGAPEVQIALLTKRIEKLAAHVKKFVMDTHTERGMLALISRRKSLLSYLKNESNERYKKTLAALGLRK